jgi:hypothetical protein
MVKLAFCLCAYDIRLERELSDHIWLCPFPSFIIVLEDDIDHT